MRSEHAIQVEYPIAGSDDGLPVIVTFTYEKAGLLDDGNSCACDTAYHDIERQRESARDMGMVRS